MYLMNVPPVAASHTKWRNCGPPQGFSLPLSFSDIELSTKDTPISDKVQMIIESLRTSQSSLDMGDETENNVLPPGQEGQPQVCKAGVVPVTGPKSKHKCPAEHRQDEDVSFGAGSEMQDSDSDDSVDRGIEEAIMEYLKEKDDHKRKAEPDSEVMQPSKVPRKDPPVPEISKQHSDSNKVLTASNQFPKFVQIETPASPPKKTFSKNKATFKENPLKTMDISKGTTGKSMSIKEQIKSSSTTHSIFKEIKVEEDSSSDDGIEEAIQMYQLEKKEKQKTNTEAFEPLTIKEESDSSSDDGIEEAIRCFQLEQLKEKNFLKPLLQKPAIKSSLKPIESTSAEGIKKIKSRKKKKRSEKHVKFRLPSPTPVCTLRNRLMSSPKGKGNGVFSSTAEAFTEEHAPATSKVNTTVELMCAEAILDISKAVMPEVFSHNVGVTSNNPNQSSTPLIPSDLPHDQSDDSSIDSEDGIEQEIRKFLEQKAQMHIQPPSSAPCTAEPQTADELVTVNQVTAQRKTLRLSLTQKRKHREAEQKQLSEVTDNTDVAGDGSRPFVSTIVNPQSFRGEKTERCGDKSSSLDSDEDLDTAIKDLLKTKKKLTKRTRDMKLKSKKCFLDKEPVSENILHAKRSKADTVAKGGILKKVDIRDQNKLSKKSKPCNKRKEHNIQAIETDNLKGNGGADIPSVVNIEQDIVQIKEESSCVDSDDSIELEIRKFLAEKEKAKVLTTEKTGDAPRNGNVEACTSFQDKDIKLEDQLAEIPVQDGIRLAEESLPTSTEPKASQDKEALPTRETVLLDNSSSALKTVIKSCLSTALFNNPSVTEPADGAGAARTDKMRPSAGSSDVQNVFSELARPQQRASLPSTVQSRSDSMKWRQCLGLPTTGTKSMCLNQTPFHVTSTETSEVTSPPHQKWSYPKPQTPATVWSSARSSTSIVPFHRPPDTPVSCSPFSNPSSATRQLPVKSFMLGLAPGGHRAQRSLPQTESSMVHMPKDQSVFVELSSNKTNHVQVRSRDTSEGKEKKKERESTETDEKGLQLARRGEHFVDETDCESDERGSPEKQGFSTLCLSSSIDHGISLRPYVALNTEERHRMFHRRAQSPKKGIRHSIPEQKRVKGVKRALQFVPASTRIREGFRL